MSSPIPVRQSVVEARTGEVKPWYSTCDPQTTMKADMIVANSAIPIRRPRCVARAKAKSDMKANAVPPEQGVRQCQRLPWENRAPVLFTAMGPGARCLDFLSVISAVRPANSLACP